MYKITTIDMRKLFRLFVLCLFWTITTLVAGSLSFCNASGPAQFLERAVSVDD